MFPNNPFNFHLRGLDAFTRYDKNHPSAVTLEAFDGAQMQPHVFREQLKRVRTSVDLTVNQHDARTQSKRWKIGGEEVERARKHRHTVFLRLGDGNGE